ncbi:hypothetical protein [Paraburkholderia adhaesiva]|uniref:hypothetical protein n=1 Tax=Paraburkholderia adhaesiva TaxID=2883244 RepID=UPI001F1BFBE4|nr:hypothetical protein [Paraburkholderia adhaesiva]
MNAVTMTNLPTVDDARLPTNYQAAVVALEQVSTCDECQSWADKAMAMASYARQAKDDVLQKMAMRIQARAIRRCGELLDTVPRNPGGSPAHKATQVDASPSSQSTGFVTNGVKRVDGIYATGHDANMSTGQIKTALRVAAVPKAEFEKQVESNDPPTVTKLAKQGTQPRTRPLVDLEGIAPEDYKAASVFGGEIRRLADYCQSHDAVHVARGFKQHERAALRANIATCGEWIRDFCLHLPE